jgi:hypothetical protein
MWKRGYSRIRDLAVRALYCKLTEPAKKNAPVNKRFDLFTQ